jgi:ABC-2 type transport system permease protein
LRRIFLIAKRDYIAVVKNKGFLFGLIGAPILFGGGFLGLALINKPDTKTQNIAIIDRTGAAAGEAVVQAIQGRNERDALAKFVRPPMVLEQPPPEPDAKAQRLELSDRVRRGDLYMFVEIGPDAVHPAAKPGEARSDAARVTYYTGGGGLQEIQGWIYGPVNDGLRRVRLAELGVDRSHFAEVLRDVPVERLSLLSRDSKTGQVEEGHSSNVAQTFAAPFVLMFLLMMVVLVGSAPMLGSVSEDKMQRVFEMLLVSASPFELLMGKVLAAVAASLTSAVPYVIGGILALQAMALLGLVPFALLPWFFVYLVADVMMLSAMGAALGSACSSPQDAQSLAIFLFGPVMIPMFVMAPILAKPNGVFATVFSLIPPFTPMLMMLRQAMPGGVPGWQPWVGIAGVAACTLAITWGAARIFRIGLLLQGKLPKLTELLKWAVRG